MNRDQMSPESKLATEMALALGTWKVVRRIVLISKVSMHVADVGKFLAAFWIFADIRANNWFLFMTCTNVTAQMRIARVFLITALVMTFMLFLKLIKIFVNYFSHF
jgi:hypothetical protein